MGRRDGPQARSSGRQSPRRDGRRTASRGAAGPITLALVVAMALIGVAGYYAAGILGGAMRAAARRGAETPTALARTVCADLVHQDYSDLMGRVDSAPAPPAVTAAFDAQALTAQLQRIDTRDGRITSCVAAPLAASDVAPPAGADGATRLLMTIWRAGAIQPVTAVLITRLSPDGAWIVERDSSFLLAT